jgi:hypothetical protein
MMPEHTFRFQPASMALVAVLFWSVAAASQARAEPATVQVYKSPFCGCCEGWVEHLRETGLAVTVQDLDDLTAIKRMAGVPDQLQSCHTAVVEGYTVEGHVPAVAIERLLRERPDIDGLAAPGMPAGSPGMPSPTPERYDVMAFDGDEASVFGSFVGSDEQ